MQAILSYLRGNYQFVIKISFNTHVHKNNFILKIKKYQKQLIFSCGLFLVDISLGCQALMDVSMDTVKRFFSIFQKVQVLENSNSSNLQIIAYNILQWNSVIATCFWAIFSRMLQCLYKIVQTDVLPFLYKSYLHFWGSEMFLLMLN